MSSHTHVRNHGYRQIIFVVLIVLGLSSLIAVPRIQAQVPACAQSYTVQPGDDLYRIALASGTNYIVLAAMNGITNPNLIYVGQVLCLPGSLPGVLPTSWLTLTPQSMTPIAPTWVPPTTDPCLTTQVQTVQVPSAIYFSPDRRSQTSFQLQPGSQFLVCTGNTNPDWTLFMLDGVYPLWVPVGVFG